MARALVLAAALLLAGSPRAARLTGTVVDADTGAPLPCRVSIRGADGAAHFPKSAGSAVTYRKERGASSEAHVTLSAHPWTVELPPGAYTVTVRRGKEYLPETRRIEVGADAVEAVFKLRRWIDLPARGWYSGETHVHRPPEELPNLQLAEDLNVAFPFSGWVLEAFKAPKEAYKADAKPVEIDPTHLYYPRNTEYEIFRVGGKQHTLGAVFILNHKTPFEEGVPPVKPVVAKARAEGALLELDKHNWPWSTAIAAALGVDLYELANNHMWETDFGFREFALPAPEYMRIEKDAKGMTEAGWIDYTFQNYYALLDCGLKMRPTAGCASGVHPVPLGFGRVYVRLEGPFGYDAWLKGLNEGRSFVTTGPMLFVATKEGVLSGTAESAVPLSRIEIVVNGEVARAVKPANAPTPQGGFTSAIRETIAPDGSGWVAVRCFEERPDGRPRWAHSAPVHVDVPGKPLRPRRVEAEFLVKRVEEEIARNAGVLPEPALEEYREALRFYRARLENAR